LPDTGGWSSTLAGLPVVLWNPSMHASAVQHNQFEFNVIGTVNIPIVLV
jgi:hypothetical protein